MSEHYQETKVYFPTSELLIHLQIQSALVHNNQTMLLHAIHLQAIPTVFSGTYSQGKYR